MVHSPFALSEDLDSEAENEKRRGIFRWDAFCKPLLYSLHVSRTLVQRGALVNETHFYGQGSVKVSFTLLNWIHNSGFSTNLLTPFFKGGIESLPL
jgi:hypothetical protein